MAKIMITIVISLNVKFLLEGEERKERIALELKKGMIALGACNTPADVSVAWCIDNRIQGNSIKPRLSIHLYKDEDLKEAFIHELIEVQIPGMLTYHASKEGVTEPKVRPGRAAAFGRSY